MRSVPEWLIGVCVVMPFACALLMLPVGRPRRSRRMAAVIYAGLSAGFNLALLKSFLDHSGNAAWGSFKFTSLNFPFFVILNLLAASALMYAAFRPSRIARPEILASSIPAACGLAGLALATGSLLSFVLLWLGVTVVAGVSLAAHGGSSLRLRLTAFAPWVAADLLLVAGAVLCAAWLKESSVLISPPVTRGSEAQAVTVLVLFLTSALVRLGAFPFAWWTGNLADHSDSAWSSFFLGTVNCILGAYRLVITVTLIGRLAASDWGGGLAIAAVLFMACGAGIAVRCRTVGGFTAGAFSVQAGFLLFALATFSRIGLEAALFMAWTQSLFLTAYLMASGTSSDARGDTALGRQLMPVRAAPATFAALLLGGLAIAGIPLTDGFAGKGLAVLAGLDKSATRPLYTLCAAACLLVSAVALVALARLLAGSFTPRREAACAREPEAVERLAPLAVISGSVLLGLFPALLLRNFAGTASRLLFATGFTGPGVAIKGTSETVERAAALYGSRADVMAAALLAVACIALCGYFIARRKEPGEGGVSGPFVGGATGRYSASWMRSWNFRTRDGDR